MPRPALAYKTRTLALTSAALVAVTQSALAREERALRRARAALARYALDTGPLDALLADVRQLRRAAGDGATQRDLPLPLPLPAGPRGPADRPAPGRPRAEQLDWLAATEARRDDVAAYLFTPSR